MKTTEFYPPSAVLIGLSVYINLIDDVFASAQGVTV